MIPEIIFGDLSPYLKDALGYVATAAAGGVIGNRVDTWFMSLFYHQRKRLIDWLNSWKPEIGDIKALVEDESLRILFSKVIADISNEIYDTKLLLWPEITDSIIRDKKMPLDKKQYFISLFNRLDVFTIKYIAILYVQSGLEYENIFNIDGMQPDLGSEKHLLFLGQIQCATTGLTDFTKDGKNVFFLTQLGREFVDFISDESKNKIKLMMGK